MFRVLGTNPDTSECARAGAGLLKGQLPSSKRFPLMVMVLALFAPLGEAGQIDAARVISLLAFVASGGVAYRIGAALRLRFPALLSIAVLCYWPLINTVVQATVDGWHVLLLLLTLYACLRDRFNQAYVFAALAAACRPESLFLPFAVGLALALRDRRVKWQHVVTPIACVLPTLFWVSLTLNVKKGYLDEVAHRGMAGPMVAVKAGSALVASFGTLPALRLANDGSKAALLTLLPALALMFWLIAVGFRASRERCPALRVVAGTCVAGWLVIHTVFPFELAAHRYGMILYMLTIPFVGLGVQALEGKRRTLFFAMCALCLVPLFGASVGLTLVSLAVLGAAFVAIRQGRLSAGAALAVPLAVLGLAVAVPKVIYADSRPMILELGRDLRRLGNDRVFATLTSAVYVPPDATGVLESGAHLEGDRLEDAGNHSIGAMLLTEQDVNYAKTGRLRASTDLRYALYARADTYPTGVKPYDLVKRLIADPRWKLEKTYYFSEHRTPLFLFVLNPRDR